MSVNVPPDPNVDTFNNAYWLQDPNIDILSKSFLRFPIAQGAETLQQTTINGDLTLNQDRIHLGNLTQSINPPTSGIAIGREAGTDTQGLDAIAIGLNAGATNQGIDAVSIGYGSGQTTQGSSSVAIGNSSGASAQSTNAVAIGNYAGHISQGADGISIGNNTGYTDQGTNSIAIGRQAAETTQGLNAVALGYLTAQTTQGNNGTALGHNAGNNNQGAGAVAIGHNAGQGLTTGQGNNAIAIGVNSARTSQGLNAIAIGNAAGDGTQGIDGIAIGRVAGGTTQGTEGIAIGVVAGEDTQGTYGISIGRAAGRYLQQTEAISIGRFAGQGVIATPANQQNTKAIAIGKFAGALGQGANSISLGGYSSVPAGIQAANCIQINATDTAIAQTTASSCMIAPIRTVVPPIPTGLTGNDFYVFYNDTTKELYKTSFAFSGSVTGTNLGLTGTFVGNIRTISALPIGTWLVSWAVNNTNLVNLTTFSIQIQLGTITPGTFAGVPNNPAAFTAVLPATSFSASVPWAQQALGIIQNSSASNNLYLCGRAVATSGTLSAIDFSMRAERLR